MTRSFADRYAISSSVSCWSYSAKGDDLSFFRLSALRRDRDGRWAF